MTIKEMKEKEDENKMFRDCENSGITVAYPGVVMTFTFLDLAKPLIEEILNDMFWTSPRSRMTIHDKNHKIIAEVGLNNGKGAKNIGDGLYEVDGEAMDFEHCVKKIFDLIDNEEADM